MSKPKSSKNTNVQDKILCQQVPIAFNHINKNLASMENFRNLIIDAIRQQQDKASDITASIEEMAEELAEIPLPEEMNHASFDPINCIDDFEFADAYFKELMAKRTRKISKAESDFTQISIRSFIIILYSYIEHGMKMICEKAHSDKCFFENEDPHKTVNITYYDIEGGYIDKAKIYLQKVIKCNLSTEGKLWSEMVLLQKIRNALVHNDGMGNDKIGENQTFQYYVTHGRLKMDVNNQILIHPKYMKIILSIIGEFFKNIEVSMKKTSKLATLAAEHKLKNLSP